MEEHADRASRLDLEIKATRGQHPMTSAFSGGGHLWLRRGSRSSSPCISRASCLRMSAPISRRNVLALGVGALALGIAPSSATAEPSLDDSLESICICDRVMKPTKGYIEQGQWDKARTNVNYCTRVLRLKTAMRTAAEEFEDPVQGIDILAEVEIGMTQLDASVYTPIFIPSDDNKISPEQVKYQQEALGYYRSVTDLIGQFLSLAPRDKVDAAQQRASSAKLSIKI